MALFAAAPTAGHPARQVANELLALAQEAGDTLTPMQIIKLVYLCHGWMLGLYGRPLFNDQVEAWAYGPVIRDVYNAVRDFRSQPVRGILRLPVTPPPFDEIEEDVIRQTYEKYGRLSGPALSRLTHAPGTPWSLTYGHGGKNTVISNDLIEDHFAELARKYEDQ